MNFDAIWQPTSKQIEATNAAMRHRYTLYGGARGPGKSYWLRWVLLRYLLLMSRHTGQRGIRVMLACEDYPALNDRHISKIKREYPAWLGRYNATSHEFVVNDKWGGGSVCFRNLDDASKYQSAEFAAIGVDEITKNPRETFDILRGSLRWPGINSTRFMAATNPGGPGHLWVKQLWIDRDFPPELKDKAEQFVFVRALPADNPHLSPTYWDELNSLPPDLSRAWVGGDWDVFQGQAFGQWRRDRHVCEPFTFPYHWRRWRAVDWGYRNPFCCLWLAGDPDSGRVYVYRELYANELTDQEQAKRIVELTDKTERIEYTLADPSMWAMQNRNGVTFSTADEYAAAGVGLTPANNDRINGVRHVRELLMDDKTGTPMLQVFSNCTNLIRTLPALPYKSGTEDVDSAAEDHAYDALRYGVMQPMPRQQSSYEARDAYAFIG